MSKIISPKAIIGLGNPGPNFVNTRHNIGFKILDALAVKYNLSWNSKDLMELTELLINNKKVILIKPQTFMNSSGKATNYLVNKNIKPEEILVIHDELEMPFGKINFKIAGSARGHNGLKSIISFIGDNFSRLRFGIGRPENREQVPDYVLEKFKESQQDLNNLIDQAVNLIEDLYK